MFLALLRLAIALLMPPQSPEATDERAHVACYAFLDSPLLVDPFAENIADEVCSDTVDGGFHLATVMPW